MRRWICILLAAVLIIMAMPAPDCLASQDVWSAFLTTGCTDTDSLSAFFKRQLKSMQSEWKSERKETSQNDELLSRRVENAILKAQTDMLEKKISQLNERIYDNQTEISRISALMSVGSATKSDLDALEDEAESLEKDLASAQKDLSKARADMADMEEYRESDAGWDTYGLDEETDFWDGGLELLTDYAFSHNAEYSDAVNSEQEALWTLWMDYTLRKAEGQDVPDEFFGLEIASGDKVDEDELRKDYDYFLVDIGVKDPSELEEYEDTAETDESAAETEEEHPEQSGFILPFPEEEDEESEDAQETALPEIAPVETESSAEGPGGATERPEVSTEAPGASEDSEDEGSEEDEEEEEEEDPDSLYNALLDYQDKAQARMDLEDTLGDDIEKGYDDLSSAWDDYISLTEMAGVPQEVALKINRVSYRVGEKTKEEYEDVIEEYKTLESDLADAEYKYRAGLYELDLATGGGMSYLCQNPELLDKAPVLELDEDESETAQFSVVAYTKDEPLEDTFTFGIVIPKKMQSEVTQFELWGSDGRIGTSSNMDGLISSTALPQSQLDHMWVRFLRNGEYAGECDLDPYIPMGQVSADIKLEKAEEK